MVHKKCPLCNDHAKKQKWVFCRLCKPSAGQIEAAKPLTPEDLADYKAELNFERRAS